MTKPSQPWRCQKCSCLGVQIPRATPRSKLCAWCYQELTAAGLRWCTKCRQGRAAAEWSSARAGHCRSCQRAANQQYRAAHLEEMLQYSRDYYAAHHEEMVAYRQAYYEQKREHLLEQKRIYYQRRRELIKAKVRAHYRRRPQWSRDKERQRHQTKRHIYKANERANALRRKATLWRRMIGQEARQ